MNKKLGPGALFISSIIFIYVGGSIGGAALGVGFSLVGLICLITSITEAISLAKNKIINKKEKKITISPKEAQDQYIIASLAAVKSQTEFIMEQFKISNSKYGSIAISLYGFCFLILIIRFRARGIVPEKSKNTINDILKSLAILLKNDSHNNNEKTYEYINKRIGDIVHRFNHVPLDKLITEYGKYMAHTIDENNIELKAILMAGVGLSGLIEGPIEKYTAQLVNSLDKK